MKNFEETLDARSLFLVFLPYFEQEEINLAQKEKKKKI